MEFNRELERLSRDGRSREGDIVQRIATLEEEIGNLAANMLDGVVGSTVVRMLAQRSEGAATLRARLTPSDADLPKVLPHPTLRARFEARVADLRRSLADPDNRAEVAKVVDELVDELVVDPANTDAPIAIEVAASVAKLIEFGNKKSRSFGRDQLSKKAITVVAGTGFEPVTFRL